MKKIAKLFLVFFLFMCVTSFVAVASISAFNPVMAEAEGEKVIADDFTTTQISASHVYKSNGVGSDANEHGIVPGGWSGSINVSDNAYIMYKLEANDGKFSSLMLDLNAKIWNQDNGDAHNFNAITIYAGSTEGELSEVVEYKHQGFEFTDLPVVDLTEKAQGLNTVYVKIKLSLSTAIGATQELAYVGVKLAKVKFTYTEETTPKTTLADDFTTTQISASHVYKSNGVGSDANEHGIVPGGWGGNVNVSENAYIMYKLESEGEFTSLLLDLNAKIWNQDNGDAHNFNAITIYAGSTEGELSEVAEYKHQGFEFTDLPVVDMTEKVQGLSTVYVKIKLSLSTAIGATQELAYVGVKLAKVKFTYTEKESEGPKIEYSHLTDNFTMTPVPECKAIEVVGIGGDGNAVHGAVPGVWGDPVAIADDSYLVYKVVAEKGFFDTLTLDLNAKIWNQNNGEAHEYNSIVVYAGLSKDNMSKVSEFHQQGDTNVNLTTVNLTEIAKDEHVIYVKIQLKNSFAIGEKQELAMIGVKLMKADFTYSQKDAEFVNVTYVGKTDTLYTDAEQIKGYTLNGYQAPEVTGYVFRGWYFDELFENAINEGYKPDADVTLYAKYEEIEYTITYVLDGGNNAEANPVKYIVSDTVLLEDPAKEGYTFKGWYTTATFEEETKIDEFLGTKMENITVYAKWEKNSEQGGDKTTVVPTTTEEVKTTTANDITTTKKENENTPDKKGCKNSLVASFGIFLSVGACALIAKKKREE